MRGTYVNFEMAKMMQNINFMEKKNYDCIRVK